MARQPTCASPRISRNTPLRRRPTQTPCTASRLWPPDRPRSEQSQTRVLETQTRQCRTAYRCNAQSKGRLLHRSCKMTQQESVVVSWRKGSLHVKEHAVWVVVHTIVTRDVTSCLLCHRCSAAQRNAAQQKARGFCQQDSALRASLLAAVAATATSRCTSARWRPPPPSSGSFLAQQWLAIAAVDAHVACCCRL
jgi:hypothetical protein